MDIDLYMSSEKYKITLEDELRNTERRSKIWNYFLNVFLVWFIQFLKKKKKRDKSKFSWLAISFNHFLNQNSFQFEWARK